MSRERWGLLLTSVLSGCWGVYDAPLPSMQVENNATEAVTVWIEGLSAPYEVKVAPGLQATMEVADDCWGTAIVVESATGEPIGRVDEAACPDWRLTVTDDGTLQYEDAG